MICLAIICHLQLYKHSAYPSASNKHQKKEQYPLDYDPLGESLLWFAVNKQTIHSSYYNSYSVDWWNLCVIAL